MEFIRDGDPFCLASEAALQGGDPCHETLPYPVFPVNTGRLLELLQLLELLELLLFLSEALTASPPEP
jgi:hypothetical protein